MLTNLLILKHQNYYNRVIKRYETLAEYLTGTYASYVNINFYKADGVGTSVVLNDVTLSNGPLDGASISPKEADYLIEYNSYNEILSRWFILEAKQTRAGQYQLSLRRDVISDNYESVINAKTYIEKATCSATDVAIYNQEDISFNQIKQKEELLKDITKIPWIVGYYANDIESDKTVNIPIAKVDYSIVSSIPETTTYKVFNYINLRIFVGNEIQGIAEYNTGDKRWFGTDLGHPSQVKFKNSYKKDASNLANYIFDNVETIHGYLYNSTYLEKDTYSSLNGKYVYNTNDQKYYQIVVEDLGETTESGFISGNDSISNNVKTLLNNSNYTESTIYSSNQYIEKFYRLENIRVQYKEITLESLTTKIPSAANKLTDAPYKMFAIPYDQIRFIVGGQNKTTIVKPLSTNAATTIATELGSSLYDLQLLPYCPYRNLIDLLNGNRLDLTRGQEHVDYEFIKDTINGDIKGIILFPTESTFSFDISGLLNLPNNAVERKIIGQCDKYRICSPNYAAAFEFNLLKTGNIEYFNVDCTYKPYSPYIHINPSWGNLYGKDFNDTRGLIVQGDFSLPIITDQWKQYQINNKNYLNSFNRQIESIELNNKYSRIGDIANAITGTASGAMVGGMSSGGVGAAFGATASGLSGVADIMINERLRSDALDLTKDQFNYSLENIQALPNTLAKISSFDSNNKLFPILEYYTCTEQEKEIFRSKLKYNGMKVMRIDTIASFLTDTEQYIKGKLIRIDINEDTHMVNTIADELNQGVYL